MFLLLGQIQVVHHGLHVLVATTGQIDHHQVILRQRWRAFENFSQGVCGFQRRDDALEAAALVERSQCFIVGDRGVFDATDVVQPGMFRTDAWIVETGGNRVGVDDLAVVVLQQEGAVAVKYARNAAGQSGGVHRRPLRRR